MGQERHRSSVTWFGGNFEGGKDMSKKAVTSRQVGRIASKVLSSKRSSKTAKTLAGSALSQRPTKRK